MVPLYKTGARQRSRGQRELCYALLGGDPLRPYSGTTPRLGGAGHLRTLPDPGQGPAARG